MKSDYSVGYQAPSLDVIVLHSEGVLCASGTTDKFTVDPELDW